MNKEYKRNCKDCGEIIEYNSRDSYSKANKYNRSCRSCGHIKRGKAISGVNNYNYGKFGKDSKNWKGGVRYSNDGYKTIWQSSNKRYIREHRIVMEEAMGRLLLPTEIVHHINEIKDDNRIDNLMLFKSNSDHRKWHNGERDIKYIYPKEEKE
jgi:hypothetical protein